MDRTAYEVGQLLQCRLGLFRSRTAVTVVRNSPSTFRRPDRADPSRDATRRAGIRRERADRVRRWRAPAWGEPVSQIGRASCRKRVEKRSGEGRLKKKRREA